MNPNELIAMDSSYQQLQIPMVFSKNETSIEFASPSLQNQEIASSIISPSRTISQEAGDQFVEYLTLRARAPLMHPVNMDTGMAGPM